MMEKTSQMTTRILLRLRLVVAVSRQYRMREQSQMVKPKMPSAEAATEDYMFNLGKPRKIISIKGILPPFEKKFFQTKAKSRV